MSKNEVKLTNNCGFVNFLCIRSVLDLSRHHPQSIFRHHNDNMKHECYASESSDLALATFAFF